ncbi:MAG TPA: FtsX-like permease family protein [Longimicrobiaceae bacterium]|nr:FtsX-like permease family protein [Longimicrobiaceae bacterium]
MGHLRRDLEYTLRLARKSPGPVLSGVFMLALGVGLGVALLSAGRASLLRPFLYTDLAPLEALGGETLHTGWTPHVRTVPQIQDSALDVLLAILLALTFVLLLVAGVNLALLLVALALSRQHEIGMRRALGAERLRLVRQFLTEGGIVGVSGSALGLLLGVSAVVLLRDSWPTTTPPWRELSPDALVVAGTTGGFTLAALVFWLGSNLTMLRQNLRAALGAQGRATADPRTGILRDLLVVVQFAASLALVVSAGLLLRAFFSSRVEEPGSAADPSLVTFDIVLSGPEHGDAERRVASLTAIHGRVSALPGVESVGIGSIGAWAGLGTTDLVHTLTGSPALPSIVKPARHHAVSPGFFRVPAPRRA